MANQENVKVVDPEIEQIKNQLLAIGIMATTFLVISPLHLGLGLNLGIVIFGTFAAAWGIFKYKERKQP
jgi:hypothetical protein